MNKDSKSSKGSVSTSTAAVAAKQAHALVRTERQGLKATDDDISGSFDTSEPINAPKTNKSAQEITHE